MSDKVNSDYSKTVFGEKYLKGVNPKKAESKSVFKNLWDKAADMINISADASGDGKVDINDVRLLKQMLANLQNGFEIIKNNMSNLGEYFNGFEACITSLKSIIPSIENGSYVSPAKQENKKAEDASENEQQREAVTDNTEPQKPAKPSMEPTRQDVAPAADDEEDSYEPDETYGNHRLIDRAEKLYRQVKEKNAGLMPEEVADEFKEERNDPLGRPSAKKAKAYGDAQQQALNEQRRSEQRDLERMGILRPSEKRKS